MFTGIVEEVGKISELRRTSGASRLVVQCGAVGNGTEVGHSVSVSGICLTVVAKFGMRLAFDVVSETLHRSSLRQSRIGDTVNLERALPVGGRIGGHFVLGHVDGVGKIEGITDRGDARVVRISAAPEIIRMVVPKGSVALDGVSLTVVDVDADSFTIWLIPHTYRTTAFRDRREGHPINIEVDILGKYVDRLLDIHLGDSGITTARLVEAGFITSDTGAGT
mgnify:CR=1 FL=1